MLIVGRMVAPRSWILVADPSGARLFASKGVIFRGDWKLVGEFQHPEGRAKPHEILTDRPGRVKQSGAPEMRAAMEPQTPVKTALAEAFARLLANKLEAGLDAHQYDRLVLVAPASFLGILRQQLSDGVAKRVIAALEKDYFHLDEQKLREQLSQQLVLP
jgi:protein required for attachment to host cells